VLSDGNVNFCCYSSAIAGNVNNNPFIEIWNGPMMNRIRKELISRRFPPECQSTSCPVFRGDKVGQDFAFIEEPHGYNITGTYDPHAGVRKGLEGSGLRLNGETSARSSDMILEFHYRGQPLHADLLVGIEYPDGLIRFLPHLDEYALPFLTGIELREDRSPIRFPLLDRTANGVMPARTYRVSSALFEQGSNPNILSNCYWSELKTIILNEEGSPVSSASPSFS